MQLLATIAVSVTVVEGVTLLTVTVPVNPAVARDEAKLFCTSVANAELQFLTSCFN